MSRNKITEENCPKLLLNKPVFGITICQSFVDRKSKLTKSTCDFYNNNNFIITTTMTQASEEKTSKNFTEQII